MEILIESLVGALFISSAVYQAGRVQHAISIDSSMLHPESAEYRKR